MTRKILTRRRALRLAGAGLATASMSGCKVLDSLSDLGNPVRQYMERANQLTFAAQRGLLDRDALAREFTASDIRQPQRPNGVTNPQDAAYLEHVSTDFANYRLVVSGRVARPQSLSLADLHAMPARRQITRHDCVEGWSCIAQWTGVPLSEVLTRAGVEAGAKYIMLHCFDTIERSLSGGVKYYETIDMVDAMHAQTILAYGMNGATLPVPNGAPLRLRVERQLGYKMAKYIRAIEVIDDFSAIGRGRGGYWEDRGYEWYAGI
ncbi:molybdopterin-dependent oxidoreductase [Roseobacter sp. YSTF-M11]|uniref:Molybdopterin-dependent oxidoreductase n=1 Tax=Roseobacter insulae TaxID=2859783 RepID=A0A9X1JXT9_9RHOB|nr:molybdopterin-dependent oxidoreductase [Roseobacter insulae]MBW4707416.1 molybdopterin-dependent oxidoreductase [Roseobacter insulae]